MGLSKSKKFKSKKSTSPSDHFEHYIGTISQAPAWQRFNKEI